MNHITHKPPSINLDILTSEQIEEMNSKVKTDLYTPPSKEKTIEPSFRHVKTVTKGWGREEIFANNEQYCGKLLIFNKGADFSTHYHLLKTESFYVLDGQLLMKYFDLTNADEKERILNKGDIVDIPRGCPHKVTAITDATIIEVSSQDFSYDSYRMGKGASQRK
jgi:mannose-6-phosphate isomerase-like protein (cupin superfamily)